jgi:hypothetical protein
MATFYGFIIVKSVADILNTVYHGRLRNPECMSLSSNGEGRGVNYPNCSLERLEGDKIILRNIGGV